MNLDIQPLGDGLRAAAAICARHRLPYRELQRSPHGENLIIFADDRFIIKIYGPARDQYRREYASLSAAGRANTGARPYTIGSLAIPQVVHTGELEGRPYLVMTRLPGARLTDVWAGMPATNRISIAAALGAALRELHTRPPPFDEPALQRDWPAYVRARTHAAVARQRSCGAPAEWLDRLPSFLEERVGTLPATFDPVLLHGDVHPGNLLVAKGVEGWTLTGLCDFGDSFCGPSEYEVVAPGVLMVQGRREEQRAMLLAYGYGAAQLDNALRARLMLLTVLYECSDLRKYALRLSPDAIHLSLDALEAAIWTFAD